jgi:hypothetical protein
MMNALGGPEKYTALATQTASATPTIIGAENRPGVPAAEIKALFEQGHSIIDIATALQLPPETVLAVGVSTGQIDPLELSNKDFKRFIITGLIKQSVNAIEGASVQLKALQQLKDLTQVTEEVKYRHERVNDDVQARIIVVTEAIAKAREKSLQAEEAKRITF